MPLTDRNIRDAAMSAVIALPSGNATVYTSPDIDLGAAGVGHTELERIEVEIAIPALTTTENPNASTVTVDVMQGTTASPTTLGSAPPGVITGAGGVGSAATQFRFKLNPMNGRYVRARIVTAGAFGNASAKNGTVSLLF